MLAGQLPKDQQLALWAVYTVDSEPWDLGWPSIAHLLLWEAGLITKVRGRLAVTAAGLRALGGAPQPRAVA